MTKKRPLGLIAIVIYKGFVALLLTTTSIVLLFTLKNHDSIVTFSKYFELEGKRELIEWMIEKVINIKPNTLKFGGIAAGVYAGATMIQAIGLWYEQTWAKIFVIGVVGVSIPLEILELSKGFTLLKLAIFLVNVAIFVYLIRHFSKH